MNAPKIYFLLVIGLISPLAFSQCYLNTGAHSKFSIELGAGLLFPSSPSTTDIGFGDATKFELGIRYLPEGNNFGFRGFYSYSSFKDSYIQYSIPLIPINPASAPSVLIYTPLIHETGELKVHRIELQGLYMLDALLHIPRGADFELESYLGIGGAFGKGSGTKGTNKMFSASIGLRPRYLLMPELHLYLDASYALLYNQQIDYAGQYLNAKSGNIGSMAQLSLGLSYRL